MQSDLIIGIAVIYSTIAALSFSKVGLIPALFWPVTIVIAGTLVYLTIVFGPAPDDK